jgi:hypothetical protein
MTSSPRRVAHSAAWQKLSVRKTVASVSRSSEAIPHRQSLPVRPALLPGRLRAGTPAMTDTLPEFAENVRKCAAGRGIVEEAVLVKVSE